MIRTTQFLLSLLLFSFLFSCGSEEDAINPILDKSLPMKKRIQAFCESDFGTDLGLTDEQNELLKNYYSNSNFKPFWTNDSMLTAKGEAWSNLEKQPLVLGLPKNRFIQNSVDSLNKELIVKEIFLTLHFSQLVADLNQGFFDKEKNQLKVDNLLDATNFKTHYNSIDTVRNIGYWLASLGPNHLDYRNLAQRIYTNYSNKEISNKTFEIPEKEKDSALCFKLCRESLIDKGFLSEKSNSIEDFWNSMAKFQEENGLKADGKIGKYTIVALNESTEHKLERAVLSLERWRWRPKFSERYVWVNIPEYLLRIYYNDTLFSIHKIVVGKPENKTPQLTSKIRQIVALPYWTQPHKIAEEEFLPGMQSSSGYAARHGYRVYRGDVEQDPSSINWKRYKKGNFPFRIKQDPGVKNALGLVKFEFNNEFGVYIHDTPQKGFFNRDIRAYSHGCMRCQNPDSLARFILRRDEKNKIIPDTLDSLIARKEHTFIPLRKPLDLTVDYISVMISPENKLVFYPDVYGRDEEYLLKIRKGNKN